MGHTVVHRAAPPAVETVLERFASRGIEATAVDEPNFIALFLSFGTYRIRISVPDEQAEEARRILADWDREAGPEVRRLSRAIQRQFLLAAVVALIVAVALFAAGWKWMAGPAFLLVWFSLLVVFGLLQRARGPGERGEEDA